MNPDTQPPVKSEDKLWHSHQAKPTGILECNLIDLERFASKFKIQDSGVGYGMEPKMTMVTECSL